MITRTNLLKKAQSHVGQNGVRFRKFAGLPAGAAWCNAFVDYIADEGGVSKLYFGGRKETYCPHSIQWCRKNLAQVPPFLALPMDIIYFDWDKNGRPNHIGLVRARKSTDEIYTIEGNTSGGVVDQKTRSVKYVQAIYRTHFDPAQFSPKKVLKKVKLDEKNTQCGYLFVYNLQCALGMKGNGILTKETVKYLQRKFGATPDGAWSVGTSKAIQKKLKALGYYKGEIDGAFGAESVCALKKWINKVNYPAAKKTTAKPKSAASASKPKATAKTPAKPKAATKPAAKPVVKVTSAQKILAKAKELAWAYGTAKSKYAYKTGAPKAVCTKAMKKYGWADNKAELSDCGNFASTVVRESGVSKTFKALHGTKTPFPKSEKGFIIVLKGKKIPSGFLKAGDIIRYKKQNGHQHVLMYLGDERICEASHHARFGAIVKDEKKYNNSKIAKIGTVQVLRAKE